MKCRVTLVLCVMSRTLGLRPWSFAKLRILFTISFFVMVFSLGGILKGNTKLRSQADWTISGKTKATRFLRWLESKELFGPDFEGYPNDSGLRYKANGQWLRANGCSQPAPTYTCTQTGTPGTYFSIFIFYLLNP